MSTSAAALSDETLLEEVRRRLALRKHADAFWVFRRLKTIDVDAFRGLQRIAHEIIRQRLEEHWTIDHDDGHQRGEMAAAACYAANACVSACDPENAYPPAGPPAAWMWDAHWWKPKGWNRDLVRAGALICVEWGRRQRSVIKAFRAAIPAAQRGKDAPP